MNPRNTALLFLVAAALGAAAYFYEIRGESARTRAEDEARRLFPGLESESIDWIEFTTSDGTAVRLEKSGANWKLAQPLEFPADEFAIDGIASALADAKSESKLENPQAPEVYGLEDAARDVRFGAAGTSYGLRVGDKAPVGSRSYAQVGGSSDVHTIATFAVNALSRPLSDLRDKRVARFDPDAVRRIALRWAGEGVVLTRAGSGAAWQLEEPLRGPADPGAVDDLLSDLRYLRADGFVDEPPPDASTGLDAPDLVIELAGGGAPEAGEGRPAGEEPPAAAGDAPPAAPPGEPPFSLRVALGRPQPDDTRLVRGAERSLYRIPAGRIDDFPRRVSAYRFRTLSDFDALDATRVELRFQPRAEDRSVEAVEIRASKQDGVWSSEPERMDPVKLDGMLRALAKLQAREILADSAGPEELARLGLEPPVTRVKVFGRPRAEAGADPEAEGAAAAQAEAPLAEVQLGIARSGGGVVARRADRATLFELSPEFASAVPIDLGAFRKSFLAPEPAPGAPADGAAAAVPGAAPAETDAEAAEVPEPPAPDAAGDAAAP